MAPPANGAGGTSLAMPRSTQPALVWLARDATCTTKLVKFCRVVFALCERTDSHTHHNVVQQSVRPGDSSVLMLLRTGASIARPRRRRSRRCPPTLPPPKSHLPNQLGMSSDVLTGICVSRSARPSGSTRWNLSAVIQRNSGSLLTSCSAVVAPQPAHLSVLRR